MCWFPRDFIKHLCTTLDFRKKTDGNLILFRKFFHPTLFLSHNKIKDPSDISFFYTPNKFQKNSSLHIFQNSYCIRNSRVAISLNINQGRQTQTQVGQPIETVILNQVRTLQYLLRQQGRLTISNVLLQITMYLNQNI